MTWGDQLNSVAWTIHQICTTTADRPRNPTGTLKMERSCTRPFRVEAVGSVSIAVNLAHPCGRIDGRRLSADQLTHTGAAGLHPTPT